MIRGVGAGSLTVDEMNFSKSITIETILLCIHLSSLTGSFGAYPAYQTSLGMDESLQVTVTPSSLISHDL